jgi:hypothetical protein
MVYRQLIGFVLLGACVSCLIADAPQPAPQPPDTGPRDQPAQTQPASQPPAPPEEPEVDLTRRLADAVDQCLRAATSSAATDDQTRRRLLDLYQPIVSALLRIEAQSDTELQLRVTDTLSRMARDARVARIEVKLDPDMRLKFRAFRKRFPVIFDDLLDSNTDRRIDAMTRLRHVQDPDHLAAPLLGICMYHPSSALVSEAVDVANAGRYDDDFVIDALVRVARSLGQWDQHWYDDDGPARVAVDALGTLYNLRSKRAAPGLYKLLIRGNSDDRRRLVLIEALGATGELRLIPHLTKHLSKTRIHGTSSSGDLTVTQAACDRALMACIFLAGSHPSAYGVLTSENHWSCYGFASAQDRTAALKKFQKWMDDNADGLLKDLQPLPLDGPKQEPASASAARIEKTDLPETEQIAGELADTCASAAENFVSYRYSTRRKAVDRVMELHQAMLEALTARAEHYGPESEKLAASVLGQIVAETRFAAAMSQAPPQRRQRFLQAIAEHPDMRHGFYSLRWNRRITALQWLGRRAQTARDGVELLMDGLRDSAPSIRNAAVEALDASKASSPALMRTAGHVLLEQLALIHRDGPPWRQRHRMRNSYDSDLPNRLVPLLARIDARQAAPYLLAALEATPRYDRTEGTARQIYDVLGASGLVDLIPTLLPRLDNDNYTSTRHNGDDKLTMTEADHALRALVKLTGQDEDDYDFAYLSKDNDWEYDQTGVRTFGFKNENARKAAVKKFKKWWSKHKDEDRYKDLDPPEPLQMPSPAPLETDD